MLSVGEVIAVLASVFLLAMIAWDWANKPDAIILPPKGDDDDDWHDWPPTYI